MKPKVLKVSIDHLSHEEVLIHAEIGERVFHGFRWLPDGSVLIEIKVRPDPVRAEERARRLGSDTVHDPDVRGASRKARGAA